MTHRQEESPADYSWTHRKRNPICLFVWRFSHKHHQQMRLNQHLTDAGMSCSSWHRFICSNANTPTRRVPWYPTQWSDVIEHRHTLHVLQNTLMLLWGVLYSYIRHVVWLYVWVREKESLRNTALKHYITFSRQHDEPLDSELVGRDTNPHTGSHYSVFLSTRHTHSALTNDNAHMTLLSGGESLETFFSCHLFLKLSAQLTGC